MQGRCVFPSSLITRASQSPPVRPRGLMRCLALPGLDAATSYRCDGHVIAACAANAGLKEPFKSFKYRCMGGNIVAKHHHPVGYETQDAFSLGPLRAIQSETMHANRSSVCNCRSNANTCFLRKCISLRGVQHASI